MYLDNSKILLNDFKNISLSYQRSQFSADINLLLKAKYLKHIYFQPIFLFILITISSILLIAILFYYSMISKTQVEEVKSNRIYLSYKNYMVSISSILKDIMYFYSHYQINTHVIELSRN